MRDRRRKGQSFVEAITAAMVLIPIALLLLDLIVIAVANSMNDTASKNAARAAANQPDYPSALDAANKSISSFHASGIITGLNFNMDYTPGDQVAVETKMNVHLPMPFPGYSDLLFVARDVEPVVVKGP